MYILRDMGPAQSMPSSGGRGMAPLAGGNCCLQVAPGRLQQVGAGC